MNVKQTLNWLVTFSDINKAVEYSGLRGQPIENHPRAAHILLEYTPHSTNWLGNRDWQDSQVGPNLHDKEG